MKTKIFCLLTFLLTLISCSAQSNIETELTMTANGILGVRNGSELKFYNVSKKFVEMPNLNFIIPKN